MASRRVIGPYYAWSAALVVLVALGLGFAASARASGGSLSGTLVYENMSPANRVLVFVAPTNVTGEEPIYETVTNDQGEWSLGSIPAGEYAVSMIVVPASGAHETRVTKFVHLEEGQALSLGTVVIGAPTVSEAKTDAEIKAELAAVGTLAVVVRTAEGQPAGGAMLSIHSASGGSTSGVPPSGVVSEKLHPGPVTLSVTDTPPDDATQVSTSAQTTVVANVTTNVTLTFPPSSPLALPAGITAHNSERDLAYLNAERARWGLPAGLTLNPVWSQGCAAHDAYLADNNRLEHPEDSSLPGASPAGEWAGLHSVLAEGPSWASEANPWESAPLHLDSLFDPDLTIVGIDESRDRTCTVTSPVIGAPLRPGGTIVTYPGDGASGFPPSERAYESPFVPGKFVGVPEGKIAGREIFVYEERGECLLLFCAGPNALEVESATLTGPSGPVEVRWVGGNTPEVGSYLTGAILIPVKPLAPNAVYTAEVTLAPYGELPAQHHRWSFRTGPPNPGGAWPIGRQLARHARSQRQISKLRVTPAAFAVTRRGRRHATGALVTYLDSANGTVSFVVYRLTAGVITGGRCAAPRARAVRKRRCTRYTRVYSIKHNDRPDKNSFRLTGRYGHHRLAPGKYRLVATSSSRLATTSFTVAG